jgi:dienelactone hydrolase/pimeloyl-ACP methyl ester carboxylesterase
MEEFGDAVDGYVDVQDQLTRYLLARAADRFQEERAEKGAIGSVDDFEARRRRVRETFVDSLGGLDDRPDDPVASLAGHIERDGYTIERLTLRSRPNFHVTANCYVPGGDGPHPGVLFLCGHVDRPKADPDNQQACIELASNGFVVLVADPVGQGERKQYFDPESGEPAFTGSGGVFSHCYAGQKCFYAGSNLARYMIHDDRCALDYLMRRSDVDDGRIGGTGASGGGLRTLYLALLDDRVDAAAPCCGVTEREEWLRTGKRIDAEQLIHGAIPAGLNFDDLITGMAPKPICVGAAASDEYFPIEGVYESVDRARRIYERYDAEDRLELTVAETTHCSVFEVGVDVFEFLCEHLENGEFVPRGRYETADRSALQVTSTGSIVRSRTDERTVEDLICEYVAERYPEAETKPEVDDAASYAGALRDRLVDAFDLDREGCRLRPRFIGSEDDDGLDVEKVWFRTERDPDIVVTGVLVSADSTADPAVILYERGTDELSKRRDEVAALAREHGTVLVFDPRGVGAVRNRDIPIPHWVEAYDGIYGTEFKLAYDALLLGTSLFGMRVFDVCRAVEFLRSETGADSVSLVGDGAGAYHALYAAGALEHVSRVSLGDMNGSFAELATSREAPFQPRLTVFGVLDGLDVPDVVAALEARDVSVSGGPIAS